MNQQNTALSIHFKNKDQLYRAYMPFIKGGGLFIPTNKSYQMGESVTLFLKILDEVDQYQLEAKVVWLSPAGVQDGRKVGIGVQLKGENGDELRAKIEKYLAGQLNATDKTETM